MSILVATQSDIVVIDVQKGASTIARGVARPSCLAADPFMAGRAWCGTARDGVFRSDDGGVSWRPSGLRARRVTAVAASPTERDVVWAGTEPSEVWRSPDAGDRWERMRGLQKLPSSTEWSFPPKPHT